MRFKEYYSLVIIINACYAALTFIIVIVSILTIIRLHINNNHYFKVFLMNINEL